MSRGGPIYLPEGGGGEGEARREVCARANVQVCGGGWVGIVRLPQLVSASEGDRSFRTRWVHRCCCCWCSSLVGMVP